MKDARAKGRRIAAICLALTALVWALTLLCGAREWTHMESARLTFSGGLEREGDAYGAMNEGPALTLPAGRYRLSWEIETDGANAIRVETTNLADVSPREIPLAPGETRGEATITALDEVYDLQLTVDYRAGSYIRVRRIDLRGGANADRAFLLTFALLGVAALALLWSHGRLGPEARGEIALLLAAALLASVPNFKANLSAGTDMTFHLERLQGLIGALMEGQFPARLGAHMQNHYGAVTSAFYPELFLYIPAGMMLLGATRNFAVHSLLTAINLAAALSMRRAASRIFRSGRAGTLAALLYTLAVYRLGDVYQRFALGEALAMCFMPLFALGLWEAVFGDKRRWRSLALSSAAILESHMLSAALCGVTAVGVCALFVARIVRERRLAGLFKALLSCVLLCAFSLAPLVTWSRQGVSAGMMVRRMTENAVSPAQLFLEPLALDAAPSDWTLGIAPAALGLPLLLGAVAAVYATVSARKRGHEARAALFLTALGMGFALAATSLFPWERATALTRGLVGYLQFPWRLLSPATVCLSLAGGWALSEIGGRGVEGSAETSGAADAIGAAVRLGVLALCAIAAMPVLTEQARRDDYLRPDRPVYWDQVFEDYTLPGTTISLTADREPHASEGILLSNYEKSGTCVEADVFVEAGGELTLPLFAYAGYEAALDNQPLEIQRGENNRISLAFPSGASGHLLVRFAGERWWRAAEAVSLAAAALLCATARRRRVR